MAIQSDRFPNARMLAERCEVSRRTIYRDLETLAAAGIPVHYRPDRQGYQLARGYSLAAPEPRREGGAGAADHGPPVEGGSGVRPAPARTRRGGQAGPGAARRRPQPGPDPGRADPRRLQRSFARRAIESSSTTRSSTPWRNGFRSGSGTATTWPRLAGNDQAEPLSARPGARDLVRGRPLDVSPPGLRLPDSLDRSGHTDRRSVHDSAALQPGAVPGDGLGRWSAARTGTRSGSASVRAWRPEIREAVWHRSQRLAELPDRRVDLHLVIDGLDEILGWVLGFGDQVEVLAPPGAAAASRRRRRCGWPGCTARCRFRRSRPSAPDRRSPASGCRRRLTERRPGRAFGTVGGGWLTRPPRPIRMVTAATGGGRIAQLARRTPDKGEVRSSNLRAPISFRFRAVQS